MRLVTFQIIAELPEDDFIPQSDLQKVLSNMEEVIAKEGYSLHDSLIEEDDEALPVCKVAEDGVHSWRYMDRDDDGNTEFKCIHCGEIRVE